ncbi:MAG TPA: signal recognition particle protein [Chloroflexota bacterium]|nr:signal recognition particle protein [Chloroflexota bacterium]
MFESLSERLQDVFERLRGKGRLTAEDVDEALKEVRRALLAADVNFQVARRFNERIRERAVGEDILRGLNPAQQVVKIVHDELIATLGEPGRLSLDGSPAIVMLVGLQGTGKTTLAGKLALYLRKGGSRPLLVACDMQRPAAVQQLQTLGKQIDVPVYAEPSGRPPEIAARGVQHARQSGNTVVILDTAGRLSIDEALMQELEQVKASAKPTETLLVVDAMTGQEAVNVARDFSGRIEITGLVLAKVDGDARGGAALSIREVTGVPIKFLSTGEKLDAIEPFHPDRLASRILGMGDVLTLIERAQESFDRAEQEKLQKKLQKATFDLEDFLNQLQQLKRMGPIGQLLEMIPGFNRIAKQLPTEALAGDQMKHVEAIIRSMTPAERRSPEIIDGSRRRRIARGSGTTPQDVNQLLGQFMDMRRMMKQMTTGGGRFGRMAAMLGQAGGPPELNGRGVHVPMPRKKERKKRKKHHARR